MLNQGDSQKHAICCLWSYVSDEFPIQHLKGIIGNRVENRTKNINVPLWKSRVCSHPASWWEDVPIRRNMVQLGERRHGWCEIWGLLRLDRPTWTTQVEEDWQLIRIQEWVGNWWNGGLVPAEKCLLVLSRIKLPQRVGEPKRINSERRMLGAFPGRQTCQMLLDTNRTSGSESYWTANCWSWGGVSRENTTPKLPFSSTLSFPSWGPLPDTVGRS